jgi:hypothetical protein
LKAHTAQPGKKKPVAATTNESVRSVQIMKKNAGQIIHLIKAETIKIELPWKQLTDFRCKTKYTNKTFCRTPRPAYLVVLSVLVIFCPLGPTNFKKSEVHKKYLSFL